MSKFKKVLMLVALAGFVGACSGNSGGGAARDGNNDTANEPGTAAGEGTTAGFAASHSGSFEILGWTGNSLMDVMSAEDLHARVADFDGLILAIESFGTMGMAEDRGYAYDRNARILRLHAGGQFLEVTADGATLSAEDTVSTGDQGQGQMTKEAPLSLPCRLYEEEVKEEIKEEEQKGEQGQTQAGEKVPAEQGQTGAAPADEQGVEQGQTAEQGQVQEVQQPEEVIVRCEQTLASEQEQGQTQAQVKPESRTEIIHVVLNLTPVVEQKQEQVVEKEEVKQEQEVKEEVKQEQKQETKVEEKAPVKEEVKQEQKQETKVEEKAPVKEEKAPEQKQEQKGEVKKEEKKEEKKPAQGGGQEG